MESLKMFRQACLEKLPFIVLSLVSSALTIMAQKAGGAMAMLKVVPLSIRVLVAAKSLMAYLWHMTLPLDLIPFYPYPQDISAAYVIPVALVVGITGVCLLAAKKNKVWPAAWGYYVITLIPVLGIVQVGGQAMADRYTYLPGLGPFLVAGLSVVWVSGRMDISKKWAPLVKLSGFAAAVLLPVFLSLLTVKQIGLWRDSFTLWTYVIEKDPGIPLAYNNRGLVLDEMGQPDKALADYNEAIALAPSFPEAYINRGAVFGKIGQPDKALADYSEAIALAPSFSEAYSNRGVVFSKMGQFDKALADYSEAIALAPSFSEAYDNRGICFYKTGQPDKSLADFNSAIALNPFNSLAYKNRGTLYLGTGDKKRASSDYKKACDLGSEMACDAWRSLR
jgi:tetratricopeptide (TPR) repeat protein